MTWTDEKPKVPGRYRWRKRDGCLEYAVEVTENRRVRLRSGDDSRYYSLDGLGGQWSDKPIPEPEEPDNG